SSVRFDPFTDSFGARVDSQSGKSLEGRLGLSLDYQNVRYDGQRIASRSHVYGIVNVYYELMNGVKVDVMSKTFHNEKNRLAGGVGFGGSYNWDDDRYSVYGEGL